MFQLSAARVEIDGSCLLEAIDLHFETGQVHGLVGHNGSGKSTLLKLLARQRCASSGQVSLDDRAVGDWGSRAFARRVAYLPQSLPDTHNLTARELVAFGRYPWHGLLGRMSRRDHAEIARAMARTQTETFADRRVESLSGGERQRVWLAMLLAQGSDHLLLDEPLSALDIAHQVETMNLVRELSHDLGLSVIVVLHDVNMVARYCDRLIALRAGRLLAQGAPRELMNTSMLESIYGVRMDVVAHPDDGRAVAIV